MGKNDDKEQGFDQMEAVLARLDALERENEVLRENQGRIDEYVFRPKASTSEVMEERNRKAEARGFVEPTLIKHCGYAVKFDNDGRRITVEVPFHGKENECPYCNSQKKPNLLDVNTSGVWQCRRCGKGWSEEALNQQYSRKLEREQFNTKDD